jgi:hypothetical protein
MSRVSGLNPSRLAIGAEVVGIALSLAQRDGARQQKTGSNRRRVVAGRSSLVGRVAHGLLATFFTWLQAGRPNDHVCEIGDYRDRVLGVNGSIV